MSDLKTILKLKRTTTPQFPGPMGWREIARRIGMKSGQLAHYHMLRMTRHEKTPRCPCCLQKLIREKEPCKLNPDTPASTQTTSAAL